MKKINEKFILAVIADLFFAWQIVLCIITDSTDLFIWLTCSIGLVTSILFTHKTYSHS